MKSYDVVAYTYRADIYHPECAALELGVAEQVLTVTPVETALDMMAKAAGVDRMNESSFDSDDFPKVVFADQLEGHDVCGRCGHELGGEA